MMVAAAMRNAISASSSRFRMRISTGVFTPYAQRAGDHRPPARSDLATVVGRYCVMLGLKSTTL